MIYTEISNELIRQVQIEYGIHLDAFLTDESKGWLAV